MGQGMKVILWGVIALSVMIVLKLPFTVCFWISVFLGAFALLFFRGEEYDEGTGLHYHYHASSEPMLQPRIITERFEPEWTSDPRLNERQQPKKKKKKRRAPTAVITRAVVPYTGYNNTSGYYGGSRPRHFRDL